jgi:hypothetical protein
MTLVPQLQDELVAAARRTAPRRARLTRRTPVLIAAVLLMLALTAVALAATGVIGSGQPLQPDTPSSPRSGAGIPKPGAAQLLASRVADPGGGLPWGLRYVRTTRGVGCLQIGRVADGRLGVLGRDGAFADDGRFHPLSADYLGDPAGSLYPCAQVDADGRAVTGVYAFGFPASALLVASHAQKGCAPWGASRQSGVIVPGCPARDLRAITAGLAGPEAVSVTYATRRGERTLPTSGPLGAYLIVQAVPVSDEERATLPPNGTYPGETIHEAPGTYSPGSGGPIVRINYRDGHSCTANPLRELSYSCPAIGLRPIPAREPTPREVRARVSARLGRGRYGQTVIVTFKAPVAVTNARAAYSVNFRAVGPHAEKPRRIFRNGKLVATRSACSPHHLSGCGGFGGPILRDVRAGERVRVEQPTNNCGCILYGVVEYRRGLSRGLDPTDSSAKPLLVGRFAVDTR